jgi:hypothetical protein
MPVKPLTASMARELAEYVLTGRIQTLHIEKRDHGRNKGKFFVEFTITDKEDLSDASRYQRIHVSEILEEVAELLSKNKPIAHLFIKRDEESDNYLVQFQKQEEK